MGYASAFASRPNTSFSTQDSENPFTFLRKINLDSSSEEALLSNIRTMAITEMGRVVISHQGGTKISIFDLEDGKHLKTMSDEDFYGPEMNNTHACERIVAISKTAVIFLFSGFVNQFVIYDLDKDDFQLVAFGGIGRKKSHAVRAITGSHESQLFLLKHPQITHGQRGQPKIVFFHDGQRTGEFKVFSGSESPILSEYFADWDQMHVLSDGSICASNAVSDRIYRYDAQGRPLQAFTYPSGILKSFKEENSGPLDFDKPETIANYMKKRKEYIVKARASDKIRDFFIVHQDGFEYIIVSRVRNTKLYLDLFQENGRFLQLGDYTQFFGGENMITLSNVNDILYVLKWPELGPKGFGAVGNPEIVVYKIELAGILER